MKLPKFATYSWFVLSWNIIVILWGAYVRASGSGAGCGRHWPLCDGQVIPTTPNSTMTVEFTHRLLSGGAIILIALLIFWGFKVSSREHPVRKGLVAAGILIIIEALLGAGLVLFELVAENSSVFRAGAVALHLANTFLLLASLALIAYWSSGGAAIEIAGNKKIARLAGIGLSGMLLIGMSGAITALGDTLFPVKTLAEGLAQDLEPNAHFLIQLRIFHPLIAIFVASFTLYLIRQLFVLKKRNAKTMLTVLLVIGSTQIIVGITNLILLAPIPWQVFHLFMADLVWITYILTSAILLAKPTAIR
jgi:heme A synthase